MLIRQARLTANPAATGAEQYPVGGEVLLTFVAENTGDRTDRLLAVASPVAGGSQVASPNEIPAEFVLAAGASAAPEDRTIRDSPTLTGLREPLRTGGTYPVTLLFEQGGAVTLHLPIADPDRISPTAEVPTS